MPRPFLALVAAAMCALPAAAQITPSTETPVVGQPLTLTFDAPVDTLTVTYRPGGVTESAETIPVGGTAAEWTPREAGVVQVAAGDASQSLSVRYASAPVSGLLVMALAGLVLFGGAAWAMRMLLSSTDPEDLTFRPDT